MKTNEKPYPITDDQSIKRIVDRWGNEEKFYDDSWGNIYIARNSMGIIGFVRTRTWENAYGILEDEFMPEADETIEEIKKEYDYRHRSHKIVHDKRTNEEREAIYPADYPDGALAEHLEFVRWEKSETYEENSFTDNPLFQEAYGFRPSGPNASDKQKHGIYAKDLNGDYLDLLTVGMAKDLELTIELEEE